VNDKGEELQVLVLGDGTHRSECLEEQLRGVGCEVVLAGPGAGLLQLVERHHPDAVLITGTPVDDRLFEALPIIAQHNPIPVVLLCCMPVADRVRQAVAAGMLICLPGGGVPEQAGALLEMAVFQFRINQALGEELQATRLQLEERKLIERAKALLMVQRQLDEDEAHRMLTRLAMDSNQRMTLVAQTVIDKLGPKTMRS